MPKRNDGKYFEKKTHGVLSKLNPSKDVVPNVRIKGKLSESSRQVDVVLKDPEEYDFIAFECKDESGSISTPTVEGYYTKLMDIGAKHGAIVSNTPFSRGARRMAAKLNIDLLNLVDTDDPAIKTQLSAPTAVVQRRVKTWGVSFSQTDGLSVPEGIRDFSIMEIRLEDGRSLMIKELANEMWQRFADDESLADGIKVVTVNNLKTKDGEPLPPLKIELDIEILRRVGALDITQSQGIYGVQDGGYQTSHLSMGPFSADDFARWPLINAKEMQESKFSVVLHTRSDLREGNTPVVQKVN